MPFSSLVLQTSYVSNSKNGIPKYECRGYYGRGYILQSFGWLRYLPREERQRREAAVVVEAMQEDMAGGDPSEPRANTNWWCPSSNCHSMPTESFCYIEFQPGQFLLDAFMDGKTWKSVCYYEWKYYSSLGQRCTTNLQQDSQRLGRCWTNFVNSEGESRETIWMLRLWRSEYSFHYCK